jgi:hypothetical protein
MASIITASLRFEPSNTAYGARFTPVDRRDQSSGSGETIGPRSRLRLTAIKLSATCCIIDKNYPLVEILACLKKTIR